MKSPEIELDHIGIAVEKFGDSAPFWQAMGWEGAPAQEVVAEQKVTTAFLPVKNNLNMELLEPTEPASTVAKFIAKRGPGIHHICFRVKNIDGFVEKLKKAGVKLVTEAPVKGAHNCRVIFVHPSSTGGVLIELSEKGKA